VVAHIDGPQLKIGRIMGEPIGSMPCSSDITSQNFAPSWFPHCPI
jgi:hypothetical protein